MNWRDNIKTTTKLLGCFGAPAGGWIAGGVIRDSLMGMPYRDVDWFFYRSDDYQEALAKKLSYPKEYNFVDPFLLCARQDINEQFDFTCCKAWYIPEIGKLCFGEGFEQALDSVDLVYTGSSRPIRSLIRAASLQKRGWRFSDKTAAAIWADILDLSMVNSSEEAMWHLSASTWEKGQ